MRKVQFENSALTQHPLAQPKASPCSSTSDRNSHPKNGSTTTTTSSSSSIMSPCSKHKTRLYGRDRECQALKVAYQGIWDVAVVEDDCVRLREGVAAMSMNNSVSASIGGGSSRKSDATSTISHPTVGNKRLMNPKPAVQVALISGLPGCGKTALAMSLRETVLDDGGYFVSGKFEQRQFSGIYGAISSAFTQYVDAVVAKGPEMVRSIRDAIQNLVLSEQRILIDVIPALTQILGPDRNDTPKQFRQSSDEVSCFKFVFKMFVRAIGSQDQPIVILFDDLHYADQSSIDLIESLVRDKDNSGILFIATFRADKKNYRIAKFLKSIESMEITDIRLAALSQSSVDEVVADILSVVDKRKIKLLTHLIYSQTSGNVFYVLEFLRYLQEEHLLTFDETSKEWQWDIRKIIEKVNFRRAVELITVRLSNLPKATREVLEVAACLGSTFDERLLDRISPAPVFTHLQKAVTNGILRCEKPSGMYHFSHDIMQEGAYKMIGYQEREAFHLAIGREIWKSFHKIEDLEKNIFVVLDQIREGVNHVVNQEERNDVAALCLRAGEIAICSSSFQVASHYLRLGVSLLATNSWKVEYELTLELYSAAAEVEYCIGNLEHVVKLNTAIVANSRRIADTIRAHSIHVYSLGSRGHMLKAIERGLKVLDGLGEKFPTKQSINSIAVAIKRTKWMIANRSNEDFLCLPMMDDPDKLASMQIMNVMFLYAYMALPTLAPLIATRMVKLTLECGLCDISSVGFVTYGMLLCGIGNDINEGFRLGELAMKVFNKFETKPWIGRIVAWYYGSICIWKKPNVTIFEPIKTAHKIALELGDVEFAMLNANTYCWESFDLSTLSKVEKVVSGFSRRLEAYGQDSVVAMIKPLWQTVHNFKGRAYGDPKKLTGEIMEQEYMVQYARENNKTLLVWCHFYCLLLCYVFEDMEAAEAHATVCRVAQSNPFASPDRVLLTFYDGLVALGHPGRLTWSRQKAARRSIKQFKVWSKHCPENFLGKLYFLEAEMAAAMGDSIRAHSKYASAVSLAREGGYIFQHALVNERAGKFFFRNGDKELAIGYLQEALAAYGVWGGRRCVKVELLEEEISRIVMI